jgi:hypothetical protein
MGTLSIDVTGAGRHTICRNKAFGNHWRGREFPRVRRVETEKKSILFGRAPSELEGR